MTLGSIARLTQQDLKVLAEAAALLLPVEIGLRFLTLDALLATSACSRTDVEAASRQRGAMTPARAATLVDRLGALYPLKATCLKKSLILVCILQRRGFPAELRLGVRAADQTFSSHAWVECDGQLLLDDGSAPLFATLPLPPAVDS